MTDVATRRKALAASAGVAGFHGTAGADNRVTLAEAVNEVAQKRLLKKHGFKPGKTAFIHQQELPLEKGVK